MREKIRKAGKEDFQPLMRFLERSYGHPRNYFLTNYNCVREMLCRDDESSPGGCFVVEKDGRIVSHVGLYPVKLVCGDVKITLGGIGNVATLPEERGGGYMGKLLCEAIEEMKTAGIALSFLGGDRQRYGHFGWEIGGWKILLRFSRRSFEKSGHVKPEPVEEADPEEAARHVLKIHKNLKFRADRGADTSRILLRRGNRVWVAPEGYICARAAGGRLMVNEVASSSGSEAGLILAALNWCFLDSAELPVGADDTELKSRLIAPASGWELSSEGMFRINDCRRLLSAYSAVLEKRAAGLKTPDFGVSFGISREDSEEISAVAYSGGRIEVSAERMESHIELSSAEAVRLFLGGPLGAGLDCGALGGLLPLPLHIPLLDRV